MLRAARQRAEQLVSQDVKDHNEPNALYGKGRRHAHALE